MTIAIGAVLIALTVALRWTLLDFAIPFAPGWHVTLWPVSGVIGFAMVASAIIRWR